MIALRIRIISRSIVLTSTILGLLSSASAQWKEKVLYSFQDGTDGALPAGGLIHDKLGNLYGMTTEGGSTSCPPGWCGTVYKLSPPAQTGAAWSETLLYVFKGHDQNDGSSPSGSLIADSVGNLYGVTGYGGNGPCVLFGTATGCGTVFELSPPVTPGAPWTETVLYSFQGGNDGDLPTGTLVLDKAGNLYGATEFGGGQGTTCDAFYGGNCGTIFKLSLPQAKGGQWSETVLHSFAGIGEGQTYGDGSVPNGGLVIDNEGALYGATSGGGFNVPQLLGLGGGVVFELQPPANQGSVWTERILHRFTDGDDGAAPNGGLLHLENALYGTAGTGGSGNGFGVVFRIVRDTQNNRWIEDPLYSFQGGTDGSNPSGLAFDSIGNLYCSSGPIVRLSRPKPTAGNWTFSLLYSFKGSPDGRNPLGLIVKPNAVFGITLYGGTGQACLGGCGTVFETVP